MAGTIFKIRQLIPRVAVAENIAGEIVYRWNSDAADHSAAPRALHLRLSTGALNRVLQRLEN